MSPSSQSVFRAFINKYLINIGDTIKLTALENKILKGKKKKKIRVQRSQVPNDVEKVVSSANKK